MYCYICWQCADFGKCLEKDQIQECNKKCTDKKNCFDCSGFVIDERTKVNINPYEK